MDTLFRRSGRLVFPVACFIVGGFHRTELHAGVAVEVVRIVVDQVDDLLAVDRRVEEHLVGCAALDHRNRDIARIDRAGLQQELALVVGAGDEAQLANLLGGELAGCEDGVDHGHVELLHVAAAALLELCQSHRVVLIDELALHFEGVVEDEVSQRVEVVGEALVFEFVGALGGADVLDALDDGRLFLFHFGFEFDRRRDLVVNYPYTAYDDDRKENLKNFLSHFRIFVIKFVQI